MKILHLLSAGDIGGIEVLCRQIGLLGEHTHEFVFLYGGGQIAELMKNEGQKVHALYPYKTLQKVVKFIKLLKSNQYDAIIVHHEGIGIYCFYILAMYFNKKKCYVKYLHCSYEKKFFEVDNKYKNILHYQILKYILKKSTLKIAVSNFVARSYCEEFRLMPSEIKTVYNGIPTQTEKNDIAQKKEKTEPIQILYIGRLAKVKGIEVLLQAIKHLIEQKKNIVLNLLGDGPEKQYCEELVRKWGLEGNIFFRGYCLDKQIYYEQAQLFIYPSIWQEAFGISIVEAMQQGLICIASNAGGIPEIIEDGVDGFLFETGSVEALITCICLVLKKDNLQEISLAAKIKSEKFELSRTIRELESLL